MGVLILSELCSEQFACIQLYINAAHLPRPPILWVSDMTVYELSGIWYSPDEYWSMRVISIACIDNIPFPQYKV